MPCRNMSKCHPRSNTRSTSRIRTPEHMVLVQINSIQLFNRLPVLTQNLSILLCVQAIQRTGIPRIN
jgi:hypothetical protein